MPDNGQEFSGKSVDEAIAEGLARLGLRQDQADIEILSRGSRGIFGLGSEPARVRIARKVADTPVAKPAPPVAPAPVAPPPAPKPPARSEPPTPPAAPRPAAPRPAAPRPAAPRPAAPRPAAPRPATPRPAAPPTPLDHDVEEDEDVPFVRGAVVPVSDDELCSLAAELLGETVRRMGFEATVDAAWHDPDDDNEERYLVLNLHGQDLSPLIGRRGETLASLQYLVRLMINQRVKQWMNIIVDVDQYKERRVNQLTQLALRMADQVAETGRAVSLEPMPPNERRVVHLALRDHPTVYTQSSGDGERRKVHIVARD